MSEHDKHEKGDTVLAIESFLDALGETSEAVDDSVGKVVEAVDATEAAAGRAILAGRFAKRGVEMTKRLVGEAQAGKPPGKVRLALETYHFLFGDD